MPEGPFGAPRPFGLGPLTTLEDEEETADDSEDINLEQVEDETARAALEMANSWYESITKDQSKHKMLKNYLREITTLTDQEIEEVLEKAGI